MRSSAVALAPLLCAIGGATPAARAAGPEVHAHSEATACTAVIVRPTFDQVDERTLPATDDEFDLQQDLEAALEFPTGEGDPIRCRVAASQKSFLSCAGDSVSVESSGSISAEHTPQPGTSQIGTRYLAVIGYEFVVKPERRSRYVVRATISVPRTDAALLGSLSFSGGDLPGTGPDRFVHEDDPTASLSLTGSIEPGIAFGGKVRLITNTFATAPGGVATWRISVHVEPLEDTDEFLWTPRPAGSFGTASNWDPPQVPVDDGVERNDTAVFALKGRYTVDFADPPAKAGGGPPRASPARPVEHVVVRTGEPRWVNAQLFANSPHVSAPSVRILQLGHLNLSSGNVFSKDLLLDAGVVTVQGPDSRWELSGETRIGPGGAIVSLLDGGSLRSARTVVDGGLDFTVAGTGSLWESGDLETGLGGGPLSTIVVDLGARAESTSVTLGSRGGGKMLVRVARSAEGVPSSWQSDAFSIGSSGTAELDVAEGAVLTLGDFEVGAFPGGSGTARVTSGGVEVSVLAAQRAFVGADGGTGTLTVDGGSTVTVAEFLRIGVAGGQGLVRVEGSGASGSESLLSVDGTLELGALAPSGSGRLAVQDGARVACGSGLVGSLEGGPGNVVVSGPDSEWHVRGDLEVQLGSVDVLLGTLRVDGDLIVRPGGSITGLGRIVVGGELFAEGPIEPGQSPGTLTIEGDFVQSADGVLRAEVAGTGDGQADRLVVTGDATLGGTLVLQFVNGFAPRTGDSFEVLDVAGTVAGDYAEVLVQGLAEGEQFDLVRTDSGFVATALSDAVALPTVGVQASPKKLKEKSRRKGLLKFKRSGSTALPLTASYAVEGTARNGFDCSLLSGTVVFPARKRTVKVPVLLLDEDLAEGDEFLEVRVLPNAESTNSLKSAVQLLVVDDD